VPWLRLLLLVALAALGCAYAAEGAADVPAPASALPLARFEFVEAPRPEVAELLDRVLREAAAADSIDREDEERMLRLIRSDTFEVLSTEGYFTPELAIGVDDSGRARYLLLLNLGRRARVTEVQIEFTGALAGQSERAEQLRSGWELPVGEPFTDPRWSSAKTRLLNRVRARDFAAARLLDSVALINAEEATARLRVEIDSGPAFTMGRIEVEGLSRFDRDLVERYSTLKPGEPFDADKLLEFQRRLQRAPYFGTVIVDVDPARAEGSALPVIVQVREAQTRRASFSLGYSTDVGVRGEASYRQTILFGRPYQLQSGISLDNEAQRGFADIYLPPRPGGEQDSVGALFEFTDSEGTSTQRWALGAQRTLRTERAAASYDNQIALSFQHEARQVEGAPEQDVVNDIFALTYAWTRRAVDSLTNPTRGLLLTLSGTAGAGRSSITNFANTAFVRGYGRFNYYLPLSPRDQLIFRGEAGYVLVDDPRVVPNEFLFRTGGVGSVRGYAFQSLGAIEGSSVTGSTAMLVASAEYVRWLYGDWGAAVFVDAGNAGNDWPPTPLALGYGLGVRYRTLAGPLALDVAYAEKTNGVRLAFSIAIAF
jgi:translocation and assembly module TamA